MDHQTVSARAGSILRALAAVAVLLVGFSASYVATIVGSFSEVAGPGQPLAITIVGALPALVISTTFSVGAVALARWLLRLPVVSWTLLVGTSVPLFLVYYLAT